MIPTPDYTDHSCLFSHFHLTSSSADIFCNFSCLISRYSCLFSDRVLLVLIYSAASRCSPCPKTRSCQCHLWLLLVIAPKEITCFSRILHQALFHSVLLPYPHRLRPHRT